ncbi:ATP-dependent zinc protease [candidate division KSB1 bacterium]|nr:ATP-dependent zinc protease [candidate division KSB1 bacterium]
MNKIKKVIGRRDKADFPELHLINVDVKIDTGAYSSSIHCHNINISEENGKTFVKFNLLDPDHPEYNEKEYVLPVSKQKIVKSSIGVAENRVFIKTKIKLFNRLYPIELSLADRSNMRYPVLIGRKVLKKRFVVDVARTNISFRKKQEN